MITNALTVDVEEYYHGIEFEAAVPPSERVKLPSRVELNVRQVLDLLASTGARATFFTVGVVAEAHPLMVRRISQAGHEIACHGYRHELVSRQTSDEFRRDVRRAKALLEDLTGKRVVGYRAPNLSIGVDSPWAYEVLFEEGFTYDSSIYPILHDRYGDPSAPRFPFEIWRTSEGKLMEVPIGTTSILGVNLPIGGGGYFRLLPVGVVRWGIRRVNRREGQPFTFYFHPWELDCNQPRPAMPFHHRFRHYVNLDRVEAKLRHLLAAFAFAPVQDVLAETAAIRESPALFPGCRPRGRRQPARLETDKP